MNLFLHGVVCAFSLVLLSGCLGTPEGGNVGGENTSPGAASDVGSVDPEDVAVVEEDDTQDTPQVSQYSISTGTVSAGRREFKGIFKKE